MYTGIFVCQDPGESVHVKMHFTCQDCSLTPHKNSVVASKNNYIFLQRLMISWCRGIVLPWSHGVKTMAEPTIQSSKKAQHRILAYGQDSDEREFSVPERQFGAKTKA